LHPSLVIVRRSGLAGQMVNGFIQIPFDPNSTYYRVVVPYGDRPFEFVFRQLKH
jgi:hypothetical protein